MPREKLATMATSGQVTTATLVWREGLSEWKPAGELAELGDVFKKLPPPLPQRSGPPPLPAQR
jgi:GYF domain 2